MRGLREAAIGAAHDVLLTDDPGQPDDALCHQLGIPLAYKDIVFQGTQSPVTLGGRTERVGFYNTFVGRVAGDGAALPAGVSVETDPDTGDVNALTGPHYRGLQFHAESILTENGFALLRGLLLELLG